MASSSPQPGRVLTGAAAWRADRLHDSQWLRHWTSDELGELDRALLAVRASGKPLAAVERRDFSLEQVTAMLDSVRRELLEGRGFVLLRGLDLDRYDLADAATIFWGIGAHLGRALPQNARGHLLGHVTDLGRSSADPTARIYQTAERQGYHTDSADLVGLMCLQRAASGGRSALVSVAAIHNEMLQRCPDLLAELFEPFCTDHRGEAPPGALPYFRAPILNFYEGELSVLYQRRYIESAQRFEGVPPLTARQIAALDAFDAIADDPALHIEMDLEPGDIQLIHNHQLLHDRTAFRDDAGRGLRRHLLRLWLCPEQGRVLPPCFAERLGSVEPGRRGGIALDAVAASVSLDPRA